MQPKTCPPIEALTIMTEAQAIAETTGVPEHPEGYDGPCACDLCMSYGEPAEDNV